jgi:hypothetical protein
VILFGTAYWEGLLDWFTEQLLANKMISKRDLKLFTVTDDPDEVVEIIRRHYNRRQRSHRRSDGREMP